KLFLQYQGKAVDVPILHNGTEILSPPESDQSDYEEDFCDEFKYESDPAINLTVLKEISTPTEMSQEEITIEEKVKEFSTSSELNEYE
ncbi:16178_t:CDS:2, partial [Acaulospora morrowiae]